MIFCDHFLRRLFDVTIIWLECQSRKNEKMRAQKNAETAENAIECGKQFTAQYKTVPN